MNVICLFWWNRQERSKKKKMRKKLDMIVTDFNANLYSTSSFCTIYALDFGLILKTI